MIPNNRLLAMTVGVSILFLGTAAADTRPSITTKSLARTEKPAARRAASVITPRTLVNPLAKNANTCRDLAAYGFEVRLLERTSQYTGVVAITAIVKNRGPEPVLVGDGIPISLHLDDRLHVYDKIGENMRAGEERRLTPRNDGRIPWTVGRGPKLTLKVASLSWDCASGNNEYSLDRKKVDSIVAGVPIDKLDELPPKYSVSARPQPAGSGRVDAPVTFKYFLAPGAEPQGELEFLALVFAPHGSSSTPVRAAKHSQGTVQVSLQLDCSSNPNQQPFIVAYVMRSAPDPRPNVIKLGPFEFARELWSMDYRQVCSATQSK